ncbi:hypothetical protein [Streptomyces sp. WAC 01438]|uniref:hypothetical protein n=1 Tax=Streptomyces sp. WAC 01438 TaxID=2203204 RepID=UPI000F745601|nr:hypothetical protein [Streptomyces sp. WAC 01438]
MVDGTADTQELWPQLLQVVKERMRFAWILLSQNASVLFYDGTTLTLNMFSRGAYDTLISSDCRIVLDEVLAELVNPPPAVELLVQGKIPSPPGPEDSTHVHAPGAASATDTSPEPDEPLTSILHRILAQTAFLLYEDGNSQAAALLADVEDLEHFPGDRPEEGEDIALIVPLYLVGRFTPEVLAAIQPLFVHVAARHDLLVDNVSAIPALPETGDEWRQNLQEKLINKTPPSQGPGLCVKETAATLSADGFAFHSQEQLLVYEALKRAQAQLPQDSTIAVFPLPRAGSAAAAPGSRTLSSPPPAGWVPSRSAIPIPTNTSPRTPPSTGPGAAAESLTSNASSSRDSAPTAKSTPSSGSSSPGCVNITDHSVAPADHRAMADPHFN